MSESNLISLSFKNNDLILLGPLPNCLEKSFTYFKEEKFTRFYPRDYRDILSTLQLNNISFKADFSLEDKKIDPMQTSIDLYDFQNEAVMAWLDNNKRGIILLPTGSGKTIIALKIISILLVPTLIVVPTLVLIDQWKNRIVSLLNIAESEVGEFGGGKQDVRKITIITYDSAYLYVKRLRTQFSLLILDEAHHLASNNYEIIADGYLAPFRLALTATLDETEQAFVNLTSKGFDRVVYTKKVTELQELDIISDFKIETIKVPLPNKEEYDKLIAILQAYIKHNRFTNQIPIFQQIIYRVNRDPQAQEALQAYREARNISFAGDSKLIELERLLRRHRQDKMIIFSDIVSFCERISKTFFIPCITHRTIKQERLWIIEYYRRVSNAKLVVSKVLDEGIDIPDAKIGVILVGSSKSRQFIQRLGRIIRHHPDKEHAILYEIISEDTLEERLSSKRKKDI